MLFAPDSRAPTLTVFKGSTFGEPIVSYRRGVYMQHSNLLRSLGRISFTPDRSGLRRFRFPEEWRVSANYLCPLHVFFGRGKKDGAFNTASATGGRRPTVPIHLCGRARWPTDFK
jgi:hypothetical protein